MTSEKGNIILVLKNSLSDDYTITKFNYIDEFSIYNGENGKWSFYINVIGEITLRHRDVVNTGII